MTTVRRPLVALASLVVALVLVGSSGVPATAQAPPPRPKLIVTVTGTPPDTAASGGTVSYVILVKNDGTLRARLVTVTIPMPPGTTLPPGGCTMVSPEGSAAKQCAPGLAGTTVTAFLGGIPAHQQPRVTLKLIMPSASTTVTVSARANGDGVTDDTGQTTTTVLPPSGSSVKFLPSERIAPIACGDTLGPEDFGADTTAQLLGPIGCTSGPWGLRITASEKTLDLNKFNIFWNAPGLTAGSVGILVSNAQGVTIIGGIIKEPGGIELFDYCVKDEGVSNRLSILSLRCFKARTAGIDIASRNAQIIGIKIDRVVGGTATTTDELPGGVGIRTRGEKAVIKGSTILRTNTVGIWASGLDTDGDGVVTQIDGSLVDKSTGIGLLLDEGPHSVKDTDVKGDGLLVTDVTKPKDGVVVGPTGIGNRLDGVVVKLHGGDGFVVNGTGTQLSRSEVEDVGLDGYVVAGSGSVLSGNSATVARHGFIVSGPATCAAGVVCNLLETNDAENLDGDGYIVTGAGASLVNNGAQGNGGVGYRIGAGGGNYNTNTAENNDHDGFLITGSNNTFKSNKSQSNDGAAVGFNVSGTGNRFNTNAASANGGWEWVVVAGQTDDGNNRSSGTLFPIPPGGGHSLN